MRKFISTTAFLFLIAAASAAPLIPIKEGTTWQYNATDEADGSSAPTKSQICYRIGGLEPFAGKELLKLEMLAGAISLKTELIAVDQGGIRSFARTDKEGNMTGFSSPQIIVPGELKEGASWDCNEEIGDVRVHQHFTITGMEQVSVPGGAFQAFHFHSEQSTPIAMVIDRWFAIGIGFVKEIATQRSPSGELLHRRTLELAKLPGPEMKPSEAAKKLSVGVSSEPAGEFETEFSNTAASLYARWEGHDLRANSKVRALWFAEDVGGIAPPDYKIDEAAATVSTPGAHGSFTLSRPDKGWAPGKYRVEFYLDETLVQTVRVTIK